MLKKVPEKFYCVKSARISRYFIKCSCNYLCKFPAVLLFYKNLNEFSTYARVGLRWERRGPWCHFLTIPTESDGQHCSSLHVADLGEVKNSERCWKLRKTSRKLLKVLTMTRADFWQTDFDSKTFPRRQNSHPSRQPMTPPFPPSTNTAPNLVGRILQRWSDFADTFLARCMDRWRSVQRVPGTPEKALTHRRCKSLSS